jgi:hypothetical protein
MPSIVTLCRHVRPRRSRSSVLIIQTNVAGNMHIRPGTPWGFGHETSFKIITKYKNKIHNDFIVNLSNIR